MGVVDAFKAFQSTEIFGVIEKFFHIFKLEYLQRTCGCGRTKKAAAKNKGTKHNTCQVLGIPYKKQVTLFNNRNKANPRQFAKKQNRCRPVITWSTLKQNSSNNAISDIQQSFQKDCHTNSWGLITQQCSSKPLCITEGEDPYFFLQVVPRVVSVHWAFHLQPKIARPH